MKIAVIVPVYKVEAYLARCVESVLAQTYENFELVLVDDGSPDRCGEICDGYARRDPRVRVVHQANGGLSAARNSGLEQALAHTDCDYVTFVDSDDWIAPNFLAEMAAAVADGTRIACCGFVRSSRQEAHDVCTCEWRTESAEAYWVRADAIPCIAWGKLYARDLFDGVRFPVGRLHEDEFTTHRLLFQCDRVMVTDAPLYHYFVRSDSITGAEWTTARSLDHVDAALEQVRFFSERNLTVPLTCARRLLCAYCTKAIHELGRCEYRGLLRQMLCELGEKPDWGEPCFQAAYPIRGMFGKVNAKMKQLVKKALKGLLPYGVVRLVQRYLETTRPYVEPDVPVGPDIEKGFAGKTVLVVDACIPAKDTDAGGKQITFYVNLLADLGFKVYLLGDSPWRREPYATDFEKKGVVILSGLGFTPAYRARWFKKNGALIDYAFLHRPEVASNFWHLVRIYTQAKLIFFGADLAQVRLQREYELTGDPALLTDIRVAKCQENFLYANSDVNLCVGSAETDWVRCNFPQHPVYEIPLFAYDDFGRPSPGFAERSDILFVGGFKHRPNCDAVVWFRDEILPLVRGKCPDVRFHVVGSGMPDDLRAQCEADPALVVHGFVSDDELHSLYDRCRLVVAPLRYGAGVKGKIVDALHERCVVVTTPVGAEGIPQDPRPFAVAERASDFAAQVVRAYLDEGVWDAFRAAALEIVKRAYSREAAAAVVDRVFC